MADNHTKEARSRNMSHIRSTNSKPEETVRKILFSHGFRYRKNVKTLPGKPDIVLPKYKTVIFVNGCFWHKHDCPRFVWPSSNTGYWIPKIQNSEIARKANQAALSAMGWNVIVVWECELKKKFLKTLWNVLKRKSWATYPQNIMKETRVRPTRKRPAEPSSAGRYIIHEGVKFSVSMGKILL